MSEQECELTDLPVSMCACRKHRGGQTPEEQARRDAKPSRAFPAQWPGECVDCGAPFRQGDMIRFSASGRTGELLGPCCSEVGL